MIEMAMNEARGQHFDDEARDSAATGTRPDALSLRRFLRRGFTPTGLICIVVALLGCLAVYNATFHLAHPFRYVSRQVLWLVPAAAVLFTTTSFPLVFYRRAAVGSALGLYLLLWFVMPFGIQVNGMRGWYEWHGIFLQPSELAKPVFVMALAALLAHSRRNDWGAAGEFIASFGLYAAWVLPILLQPDFGTVLVYTIAFLLTYVCAGGGLRQAGIAVGLMIPAAAVFMHFNPYVVDRFAAFTDPAAHAPGSGWHILQFQRTLASGGMLGQSWGQGIWSQNYLPFGYSDSIFATLGETLGFIGLLPLILILLAWVLHMYRGIQRSGDYFATVVLLGMTTVLAGQAFVHLSVNLGLLPPTGLTLPLISYGGSSLAATAAIIGISEAAIRDGCQ